MRKKMLCLVMVLFGVVAFCEMAIAACECEMAAFQNIDVSEADGEILSVALVPATASSPEYCKVGVNFTMPYDLIPHDADIYSEIWLPSDWNGKYLGTGNGGAAPAIRTDYLTLGVSLGYATANTTMGTHIGGTDSLDFRFGMEMSGPDKGKPHPERWLNFGYRATHLMSVAAKKVIATYYGKGPDYSYFLGASTGGQQALKEAQAYPEDYDGIVAGAAALDRTHVHMQAVWIYQKNHESPESYIPKEKWAIITPKVIEACDGQDGVLDGLIDDPRNCHYDGTSLLCEPGLDSPDCLTPSQLTTLQMIWDGAQHSETGEPVYPGLTKGAEWFSAPYGPLIYPQAAIGLPPSEPQPQLVGGYGLLHWALGPDFDCKYFNWDSDVERVDSVLAPILNSDNPDLTTFQQRGGKLILYHGWADPLVHSMDSVIYYEKVLAMMGGLHSVRSFARLFMAPGWGHCGLGGYGPGPVSAESVKALATWVETGEAPGTISHPLIARGGAPYRTRPLCPYPEVARWNGSGDETDASNFMCVPPIEIQIVPGVLNLRSNGFFMARITLPEGYSVRDWGIDNLQCEGASAMKVLDIRLGRTYLTFFRTRDLIGVPEGDQIPLTVKGTFEKEGRSAILIGHDLVTVLE